MSSEKFSVTLIWGDMARAGSFDRASVARMARLLDIYAQDQGAAGVEIKFQGEGFAVRAIMADSAPARSPAS